MSPHAPDPAAILSRLRDLDAEIERRIEALDAVASVAEALFGWMRGTA